NVNLYRDGELVQTVAAGEEGIVSGDSKVITLTETTTPLWNESATYTATIDWAADEDDDNDVSADVTVAIKHTTLPVPTELTATADGEKVNLAWTKPAFDEGGEAAVEVTEGFEDLDAFAINPECDWTFVDKDGSKTYGIQNVEFPGSAEPMAYIVLDASYESFNETFAAYSGDKYLASFAATTPANDDWAISPMLSGTKQTVSFYARTYTAQYGNEEFEFLYSTTGTAIADFTSLGEVHDVPTEWTEYRYELPEGAKYFAIRCISSDRFIFMVDEVSFTKNDAAPVLAGYNIYRDGVKINAELVTETSFVDETAEVGEHTYQVTAVYDRGESDGSNKASTVTTGVENVAAKGALVATGKNVIIVKGAANMMVTVAAADGRLVYAGKGAETMNISVAEGVYAVKVGSKVVKTIVQ
ncbi:MAG: choice-of-anchor J domain-containing protein, partial [Muribaculaceae bacterium]